MKNNKRFILVSDLLDITHAKEQGKLAVAFDIEGMNALTDHELAVRLSYFLWSRPPDAELAGLVDAGKLSDDKILAGQVDRLIDDPRSLTFARAFVGQWLGTKDVGGRVAPVHNTKDLGYTNEVAADLREEAVRYYHHLLSKNRNLFELVDSDYALGRNLGSEDDGTIERIASELEKK